MTQNKYNDFLKTIPSITVNDIENIVKKYRGDDTIIVVLSEGKLEISGRYSYFPKGGGFTATLEEESLLLSASMIGVPYSEHVVFIEHVGSLRLCGLTEHKLSIEKLLLGL